MTDISISTLEEKISGCLLGMAVADALGLPREGLSPKRAKKLYGEGDLQHRFILGRGLVSDDTEHACMTAQAVLKSKGERKRFQKSLAWRLKWWLLGLPSGIGLATLKSILKLWMGISPAKSGVFSAGNGPAMRAPILGVLFAEDKVLLEERVQASTRITHVDPRAEEGARVIALAATCATEPHWQSQDWREILNKLRSSITGEELLNQLQIVEKHLEARSSAPEVAKEMGLEKGVTGYINHTVPMVIFCWLRYWGDFKKCVTESILLGGDADTVGAIAGALAGATVGRSGIPQKWLKGLWEWPRSVQWMSTLSMKLARASQNASNRSMENPVPLFWPALLLRNLFFLLIVLFHGFRRLLPPY